MTSITWVKIIIQLLSGPPVKMTNDPYQKSISWQRLSAHNFTTTERAVAGLGPSRNWISLWKITPNIQCTWVAGTRSNPLT